MAELKRRNRYKSSDQWGAMMPRLVELNAAGNSAKQIMIALNEEFGFEVTRNAVMGKIHRNQMRQASNTGQPLRQAGGRPKDKADKGALVNHGRYFKRAHGYRRPPEITQKTPGNPLTLMELQFSSCRWPIGEPSDMRYCGADRKEPLPYCEDHARRAYDGTSSRRRQHFTPARRSRAVVGYT